MNNIIDKERNGTVYRLTFSNGSGRLESVDYKSLDKAQKAFDRKKGCSFLFEKSISEKICKMIRGKLL